MMVSLFIVSLLALVYFLVAKINNKAADQKLAAWKASNQNFRKPEVVSLFAPNWLGVVAGIFFVGILFFWLFIVRIGGQEVGVVETPGGIQSEPMHTGWHLVLPWYKVHKMDKTVWVYTFSKKAQEGKVKQEDEIWAPTSEGIKMGFDLSVSWKIDAEYAPWIYQNVSEQDGSDEGRYLWLEENIIRAKTKSAFALTISRYNPIECYSSKRQEIQQKVYEQLAKELSTYHIILNQVDVREVFYNPDYEKIINAKKLAEQEVMRLEQVTRQKSELLLQARIEKDITITSAQAESEALRIKGNAITNNPKIIQLEYLKTWNGVLPTTMIGGNSQGFLLNMNLN